MNFVKFLRTPFLQNTSGKLLPLITSISKYSSVKHHFLYGFRNKKSLTGLSKCFLMKSHKEISHKELCFQIPNRILGITAQKMKFPIKDFFGKFDQISTSVRIWSHLLKKSLMESFIFCAVNNTENK